MRRTCESYPSVVPVIPVAYLCIVPVAYLRVVPDAAVPLRVAGEGRAAEGHIPVRRVGGGTGRDHR